MSEIFNLSNYGMASQDVGFHSSFMAKKSKPGPFPEMGKRVARVRVYLGGSNHGDQKAFAEDHGFSQKQWNHWENGHSIPWQQAVRLIDDAADGSLQENPPAAEEMSSGG